ncbi:MAG: FAD-dependent oxidoreductase [Candidatus Methanofastidiosia archaeon]|jgi:thioredoxin reductase (NADPH)
MTSEHVNLSDIYDIIIIGGGPAGLSAAAYAARANLKTIVLDKNPKAGALGSSEKIENYPGILEPMSGIDFLSRLRKQARKFGAETVKTQVLGVQFTEDKMVTAADSVYTGKTVIIATGAMGRTPSITGEEKYTGKGVSYCATCDAPFFTDKPVAVIGDMEKILEEIDVIARFASDVYVVSRKISGEHTKITDSIPEVELVPEASVTEIFGDEIVKGITIKDKDGIKSIEVAGVFVYLHGNKPVVDFLYGTLELVDECIAVDDTMATSVEGVFAAGDVTCKRFRQVVLAAAEGCTAALSADKYINKRKRVRPQWSH